MLTLAALIYAAALSPNLSIAGDDEAHYIILAKSMAAGQGYRDIYLPGSPLQPRVVPAVPFLITPLVFFFGVSLMILRIFPLLCAVFSVAALYYFLKKDDDAIDPLIVTSAVIILAFNPHILYFSGRVMTELPYMLLSLLALYIFDKYTSSEKGPGRYAALFMAIISTSALFYVRNIGAALFIALFIYSLFKKEYRTAFLFAASFALLIFPWLYHDMAVLGKSSFPDFIVSGFMDSSKHVDIPAWSLFYRVPYYSLAYATVHMADLFFYPFLIEIAPRHPLFMFKFALGTAISTAIACGFVSQVRRRIRPHHLYAVVYFGTIAFFYSRGERYLVPILPFLAYYLATALKSFKGKVLPVSLAVLVAASLCSDFYLIYKEHADPYSPDERSYLLCADWLKKNSLEESVILCRKPRFTYLYTGRKTCWYPYTRDPAVFKSTLQKSGTDYIIVDSLGQDAGKYLKPFIASYKERLEAVYATPAPVNYIYKVKER